MGNQGLNFSDPAAVRRTALIISFAITSTTVAFAVFATGGRAGGGADLGIATEISSAIGVVLSLISIAFGRRMYAEGGDLAERTRRAFTSHVIATAVAEGCALFGLALMMAEGSQRHVVPAALGGALLVVGAIRAVFVFGRLVDEKERGA